MSKIRSEAVMVATVIALATGMSLEEFLETIGILTILGQGNEK